MTARLESLLHRLVPWAALATVLLWLPSVLDPHHSCDDADPEVLNNAYRLARGEPLYHALDAPPWVVSPYTPLYTALVALGLSWTGLSYTPARLISLASALAVVAALASASNRQGLWAACLLALVPAVLANAARPHPQMLAVALSIWSLLLFQRSADRGSALLSVLAIYAKQSQVALPLALLGWLALHDRRRLGRYAAYLALLGLLPIPFLQVVSDGHFLPSILGMNLLGYDGAQILPLLLDQTGVLCLFLGLALFRLARRPGEPIGFYLGTLIITTVASLGRPGAYSQYVLELLIVTVLYLLQTGGTGFPDRARILSVAQLALAVSYGLGFTALYTAPRARASQEVAGPIRSLLLTRPGPIISEQGSFSLFTRHEIHLQLFHFAALARQGKWDQRPLLDEIEGQRLAWVVTAFPLEEPIVSADNRSRFTPQVEEALRRGYLRQAHMGPYFIYAPRPR